MFKPHVPQYQGPCTLRLEAYHIGSIITANFIYPYIPNHNIIIAKGKGYTWLTGSNELVHHWKKNIKEMKIILSFHVVHFLSSCA